LIYTVTSTNFTPPPPPPSKSAETGVCPEISTKLYVHELGFSIDLFKRRLLHGQIKQILGVLFLQC
jgi:hypothetical protein